ncbi:MAG TPA: hypothetical protein DIS66_07155 [Candidatus Omnitrophica bacterium]|nr:hypothetical protein [Candidatus Omnitrophota bacterium]
MKRDLYLQEALRYVPHLIELSDRNLLSPTFGCFDRAYWHYRTADFPSGMFQEAVLPLALLYKLNHPLNPLFGKERIRELVIGGIEFAIRSAHADGSCDDYFPYERAAGAAAFSLYACTEAFHILGLEESHPHFLPFFKKRAENLAEKGMRESGTLSNHKALIVLAVYNTFLLVQEPLLQQKSETALLKLLSLQNSEGWFPEYEGCDPGYLTFTIDFLAKYYQKSNDVRVIEPLDRAISFAAHFLHPDGSFGGEYGSRNTFHFMPHGFELMGVQSPQALPVARAFLNSLELGTRSYIDDDRIMIHYVYNYIQAYTDYCQNSEFLQRASSELTLQSFPQGGLAVFRQGDTAAIFSTKKGNGKIFKKGKLIFSDSGVIGKSSDGVVFTSHVFGGVEAFSLESGVLKMSGKMYRQDSILFTPWTFWIFRAFLIFAARWMNENTVRKMLQKKAILKKKIPVPLTWSKEIDLHKLDKVTYTLNLQDPNWKIADLQIAADATFIYIAASQPYQPGNLLPWIDLKYLLPALSENKKAVYEHILK